MQMQPADGRVSIVVQTCSTDLLGLRPPLYEMVLLYVPVTRMTDCQMHLLVRNGSYVSHSDSADKLLWDMSE